MIVIGIDCGKTTGLAVYDSDLKVLFEVNSYLIHNALIRVEELYEQHKDNLVVFIENPNTYVPFNGGAYDRNRLQGAGSIKRDYSIWIDFLEEKKIRYIPTRLQGTLKKISGAKFKEITGWQLRTNEHSRDAALIVYGRTYARNK